MADDHEIQTGDGVEDQRRTRRELADALQEEAEELGIDVQVMRAEAGLA